MAEKLRERQRRMARELIMQTAADLIVEQGLEDLSLADIAAEAGVSKRTLYNHFESREALLAAIVQWSNQLTLDLGGYLVPEGLDTLPDVVQAVWRTWAAQGTIHQAVVRIDAASSETGVTEDRKQRRAALATAVEEVRPDLTPERADEVGAIFHAVSSAPVFERLTAQDGLDVETAGALVGWALSTMRDALAAGKDPFAGGSDH